MARISFRGGLTIGLFILIAYLILLTGLGYIGNVGNNRLEFPDPEKPKVVEFTFSFMNQEFTVTDTLYNSYYKYYQLYAERFPNIRTYVEYYKFIKEMDPTDDTITRITNSLQELGAAAGFNADQTLELAMRFVQSIPYDVTKADQVVVSADDEDGPPRTDLLPRHPYITLYDRLGVCSDKTVLAAAIAEEMGYATAIFSFDREVLGTGVGHVGLGVKCPLPYSHHNSGYCYVETTAPVRIGMSNIYLAADTQAATPYTHPDTDQINLDFSQAELYKLEEGKIYYGIIETRNLESRLRDLGITIDRQKEEIDRLRIRVNQLNTTLQRMADEGLVQQYYSEYARVYDEYELSVRRFNGLIEQYNENVDEYNQVVRSMDY